MGWFKRTIVHGLEIVNEREDIPVAHRYSLEHRDLVPDLFSLRSIIPSCGQFGCEPYHVFPAGHQPLVDNFGSIIPAGVDVDAFLDD